MIMAGGSGSRAAARVEGAPVNKVHLLLDDRPVLAWSIRDADRAGGVTRLVVVVRAQDRRLTERMLAEHPPTHPVDVVVGGATRHDSETAGFAHLDGAVRAGEIDVIAVHDGARPLAGSALFTQVIRTADEYGGAVPGVSVRDLVTSGGGPTPAAAAPGTRIVRVQTPQAFRAGPLLEAYAEAERRGFRGTDTASSVEAFSTLAVHVVESSPANLKITYPGDLERALALLARRQ